MRQAGIKRSISFTIIFSLLLGLCYVAPASAAADGQTDEFNTLRMKWFDYLTGGAQLDLKDEDIRNAVEANATKVTNAQKNGAWDTLNKTPGRAYLWADYNSTTNSSHITLSYNRLKDMAIAWATPGTSLYQDEMLKADILAGLDWMHANRFNSQKASYNNWWDWEIGSPLSLADIVTIMYEQLTEEQITAYTSTIDRFIPDPTKRLIGAPGLKETGANLLDKSLALLLRAVLDKNEAKLKQARAAIDPVFPYVTSGDGFYEDGSFIQHGNIAYTGSYGSVLLGDISKLLTILDGSSWPIEAADFDHVWEWVTDSFEPVIYDGHIMEMVSGRAVSRFNNNTRGAVWTILRLAQFAPPEQAAYFRSMVKEWVTSDTSMSNMYEGMQIRDIVQFKKLMSDVSVVPRGDLIAHYSFPVTDRVVHSRAGYTFGISMSSARISNFEGGMNSEHMKGWYTGDGMTYLYNRDTDQFRNAFWPTVDSRRMPGTTSDGLERTMIKTTGKSWVGGLTMDGQYGSAGMDLAPPGSKLTGKKSWFMFDDEIVAVGAGIGTPNARTDGKQVETIVENRIINQAGTNQLTIDGITKPSDLGWSETVKNAGWAHLEGTAEGADIGYYFPTPTTIEAMREARTGSWKEVNATGPSDPITRNYVNMAIGHGVQPQAEGYSYVLLPTFNKAATEAYHAQPDIQILSNTEQIQAVQESKLGLTGIHFWQAGTFEHVRSSQPAAVMLKEQDDELTITVADPTQTQAKVKLEVAAIGLKELEKDSSVQVLQMTPSILLEIDTRGAKGSSHTIKLKVDPEVETELPEEGALEPDDAAKIRIPVVEDTFVNGGTDENTNFGSRGFLNIRNGKGNYDRSVFLKYDLSTVTDEVEKITLHVYGQTKDSNGTQSDIGVFAVQDDTWKEDQITYKNKPQVGEQIDLQTIGSPDQWWQFNVTPFALTKLQTNSIVSLALQQVGRDLSAEMRSRKNEGGQYQSYLEVLLKDKTAPITTVQLEEGGKLEGEHDRAITLLFSAADQPKGWGVLRTEYRISGGKWKTVKGGKLLIEEAGKHQLEYRSIDKAGNVEEAQSIQLSIIRPSVELSGPNEVTQGEDLLVKYGIRTTQTNIFANQITLSYDDSLLKFVAAKSLQAGISIIETRHEDGKVELVAAGEGRPLQADAALLQLTFEPLNAAVNRESKIEVTKSVLGDQNGNDIELAPSSFSFLVKAKEEKPGVEGPDPGNGSGNGGSTGGTGEASINDLEQLTAYYGNTNVSADWDRMKAMDLNGDGRIDLIDVAAMARKIKASSSTTVPNPKPSQGALSYQLEADKLEGAVGDTVSLNITGKNVNDLYAYELQLSYDPAYLEWVDITASANGLALKPIHQNGKLTWIHTLIGNKNGESGDLILGTVTFKVKKTGLSEVRWNKMTTVDHLLKKQEYVIDQAQQIGKAIEVENIVLKDTLGHWAYAAISEAIQKGIVKGYSDQTFRPDQPISRAEFTALLVRGLQLKEEAELSFADMELMPLWAKDDIAKGIKQGFITGYPDHTFRASQQINRIELAVMAARALGLEQQSNEKLTFADTGDIPVWAQGWIASAVNEGLIKGRGSNRFAPQAQATRAEAVIIVLSLLNKQK